MEVLIDLILSTKKKEEKEEMTGIPVLLVVKETRSDRLPKMMCAMATNWSQIVLDMIESTIDASTMQLLVLLTASDSVENVFIKLVGNLFIFTSIDHQMSQIFSI